MMLVPRSPHVAEYWRKRRDVVGAFWDLDFLLFDWFLSEQQENGTSGDLLEIGAYFGKSAILLGLHAREAESVIICDVFGDEGADEANSQENSASYVGLSRSAFEANYRHWIDADPVVVQELSFRIRDRVTPQSLRFAHIDGGHLYEVVQADIANVRGLMADCGLVVLDDFRAIHTPGVAASVWSGVVNGGLIPICISEQKFYGTWNREVAKVSRERLRGWLAASGQIQFGRQNIAGHEVILMLNPAIKTWRSRVRRWVPAALLEAYHGQGKIHLGN